MEARTLQILAVITNWLGARQSGQQPCTSDEHGFSIGMQNKGTLLTLRPSAP